MNNIIIPTTNHLDFNSFSLNTSSNQFIATAFNEFKLVEQIKEFMIKFFMYYSTTIPNLKEYGFKRAIDEVNKQLMQPVNELTVVRRIVSEEERKKIKIWHEAHGLYEAEVLKHLVKLKV